MKSRAVIPPMARQTSGGVKKPFMPPELSSIFARHARSGHRPLSVGPALKLAQIAQTALDVVALCFAGVFMLVFAAALLGSIALLPLIFFGVL